MDEAVRVGQEDLTRCREPNPSRAALQKPSVVERLAALGSDARASSPEEFTSFLVEETRKWSDVMKQANIKVTE